MQDEARRVDHASRETSPKGEPVREPEAELQLVSGALPSPRERGRPGGTDALKIEALDCVREPLWGIPMLEGTCAVPAALSC